MDTKIKILLAVMFSFVVSRFLSNTVFISGSTRVNTAFFAQIPSYISSVFRPAQNVDFARIRSLPNTALKSVGKGVYAKDDETGKFVYIRVTKDAQWEERIINYNGKQIKVSFPKNVQ